MYVRRAVLVWVAKGRRVVGYKTTSFERDEATVSTTDAGVLSG